MRKAVVFCLVDMYMVRNPPAHLSGFSSLTPPPLFLFHVGLQNLGMDLVPHLKALNTSQIKLVQIYINRKVADKVDLEVMVAQCGQGL